jgi:hypothetical protein
MVSFDAYRAHPVRLPALALGREFFSTVTAAAYDLAGRIVLSVLVEDGLNQNVVVRLSEEDAEAVRSFMAVSEIGVRFPAINDWVRGLAVGPCEVLGSAANLWLDVLRLAGGVEGH